MRGVSGDTGVRRVLEVLRCRLERVCGLVDAVPAARVLRGELDLPLAPATLGGLLRVRPADVPGQNLRASLVDVVRLRRRLMLTVRGRFGTSSGVARPRARGRVGRDLGDLDLARCLISPPRMPACLR
jgi:hypothetical protein